MAWSSSQIAYAVFLCLLLISKLKGISAKTMSDNTLNPGVFLSSPPLQITYDVFVSFRGADIRQGFLSHLIKALSRNQIVAFVDDKLERGDEISEALAEAIERSFISLVIFSQDYASSRWCLEELVKIVECKEKNGQIVIPVFYNVDPSNVRHQKGSYGNALAELEKKFSLIRVQIWRSALKESANVSGFHSSNFWNDAELLEEILKCVRMKLKDKHRVNSKELIGIDKPIAHLESLLLQELKNVHVIGIWGMGGIGKTTIAEEVFRRLCFEYEGCCFLANVRDESARHGIISLKKKLFSTLLGEDLKTDTPNGLSHHVERRIGHMKVLIVLDDVNDSDQLEILVGAHDWFGPRSRIIVTTRDKQVLANKVDDSDIYKVEALDFDEALELFNLNAFKQNHLGMEYYELSKRVVNYAKGIPLVLKVLGQLLCGKDKEIWESQLGRLKKMPPSTKVHHVMKLSYDDLDRKEQKIFLDLACFFNGLNLRVGYIKQLLKDHEHDYSVAAGLERLKDKALVTISEDNIISMHDIIQEMAWEIVRQRSIEEPGSRSRLWDPDEIYEVLKNDKGTEAIRSITVHLSTVRKLELSPHVFAKMSKLQFLNFYGNNYQDRLDIPQGLQYLPNELRYLSWMNYPSKSLPEKFYAEKLVILDLSYSQVEKLWHGVQNLVNLKVVKLHSSIFLMELPDFSKATNLEEMDISNCSCLTGVHPSIFSLDKLEMLDLSKCTSLTKLTSHTHLNSLSYLSLRGCKTLKEFSVTSDNMIDLDLQFTSIDALPSSIGCQSKLETLHLGGTNIKTLPTSIKHLTSLRHLDISYCWELQYLEELPPSLEKLDADGCISLEIVLFPSNVAEQLREHRKRVEFWNCLKLDYHSLKAIGLNAQINMMKLAYQHSFPQDGHQDYHAEAIYVYPGSIVPEWLDYRTTNDYITIDLSSAPRSPFMGFILCFIVPRDPSMGFRLRFIITISDSDSHDVDGGGEGKGDSVELYMLRPSIEIASDHVCVMYDQLFSRYLNGKAQNHPRFKIKVAVTTVSPFMDQRRQASMDVPVMMKGFGISLISTAAYHNFIQQMGLDHSYNSLQRWSFTFYRPFTVYIWNWVVGSIILCNTFMWCFRMMNLIKRKVYHLM